MKNRNYTVLVLALLALGMTASQIRAQPTHTLYAFTNFAGMPGGYGNVDGIGSVARFSKPTGVAVDVADWAKQIRR